MTLSSCRIWTSSTWTLIPYFTNYDLDFLDNLGELDELREIPKPKPHIFDPSNPSSTTPDSETEFESTPQRKHAKQNFGKKSF